MTKERLDNHCACIPAPRVQPVRQQTHRVTASQTEKPADPDDDPTCFHQTADLAGVHTVADYPQHPFGIPGGLTAGDTMSGTNSVKGWSIRAFGAELLDSDGNDR